MGVKREGGLGRRFGIGAGINGGCADAVAAEFVEEGLGEMVQATFNGGGDRAAGGRAVAIPAQDDKVALFLAQPGQHDAREGDGREQTDVDAFGQSGDGRIQQ